VGTVVECGSREEPSESPDSDVECRRDGRSGHLPVRRAARPRSFRREGQAARIYGRRGPLHARGRSKGEPRRSETAPDESADEVDPRSLRAVNESAVPSQLRLRSYAWRSRWTEVTQVSSSMAIGCGPIAAIATSS